MYIERLNRSSIKVIQKMQELTVEASDPVVPGTGHLLLALLEHDMGFAAQILSRFGLKYRNIKQVEKMVKEHTLPGERTDTWIMHRANELDDTLVMASYYANVLGSSEIDTEHLLMGMFCKTLPAKDGLTLYVDPDIDRLGAKIIRRFGIAPNDIDAEARKLTAPVKQMFSLF